MSSIPTERGPFERSYWVVPGKLLVGPHPGDKSPDETRERLAAILNLGIETFIDLTEVNELTSSGSAIREYSGYLPNHTNYKRFSIADRSIPIESDFRNIIEFITNEVKFLRPIYLHCRGGKFRTGMTVACFLISHNLARPESAAKMEAELRKHYHIESADLPKIQLDFIERWRA